MAFNKYYVLEPSGTYLLHFPNFEGYTVDEVHEMFSEFGKVQSVDNRGQVKGLCFVRYTDLESVKACIKGFKKNKKVRILKHKQHDDHNAKQNQSEKLQTQSISTQQCTTEQSKSKSNANDKQKRMTDIPTKKLKNLPSLLATMSLDAVDTLDMDSSANSSIWESVSMVGEETGFEDYEHSPTTRKCQKLLELIPNTSSKSSSSLCNLPQKGYSGNVAREVIVANIHPDYGIHYILHLFEKYGPIAVTLMKTVPMTKIRYCIVYFRSSQAAEAIEDAFDNFPLAGRNLIVLRPFILKQEAS